MTLQLARGPSARRIGLAPMIDVVFLLLIFFMLAASFEREMSVPISGGIGGGEEYEGPPRLLDIGAETLQLNGQVIDASEVLDAVKSLTHASEDTVILRAGDGADLQRLVDVIAILRGGGLTNLVLVE